MQVSLNILKPVRTLISEVNRFFSLAFRIHVSQQIKDVLDEIGGYNMEYRGPLQFQGGIETTSYWLLSSNDFHKPLPEPPPLTSCVLLIIHQ